MNPTGCCPHSEKEHCPGDVSHMTYKDTMRMNPNPAKWKCPTRHCTAFLCCCVGHAKAKAPTPEVTGKALDLAGLGKDLFGN